TPSEDRGNQDTQVWLQALPFQQFHILFSGERHGKVCSILDEMGRRPPREISGSKLLSRLAKLSLCEEQHRHQEPDVLERWEDMSRNSMRRLRSLREPIANWKPSLSKNAKSG